MIYQGFDRTSGRNQRIETQAEELIDPLEGKDMKGHGKGGTNYWVNDDPRPTKEEVLERLEEMEETYDLVDYLVPEEVKSNLPPWIRPPLGWMFEVAEIIVEVDPLDRIQD